MGVGACDGCSFKSPRTHTRTLLPPRRPPCSHTACPCMQPDMAPPMQYLQREATFWCGPLDGARPGRAGGCATHRRPRGGLHAHTPTHPHTHTPTHPRTHALTPVGMHVHHRGTRGTNVPFPPPPPPHAPSYLGGRCRWQGPRAGGRCRRRRTLLRAGQVLGAGFVVGVGPEDPQDVPGAVLVPAQGTRRASPGHSSCPPPPPSTHPHSLTPHSVLPPHDPHARTYTHARAHMHAFTHAPYRFTSLLQVVVLQKKPLELDCSMRVWQPWHILEVRYCHTRTHTRTTGTRACRLPASPSLPPSLPLSLPPSPPLSLPPSLPLPLPSHLETGK